VERHLKTIKGNWNLGVTLDLHTKSSIPIFNDDGEITGWDTERTEIGEELYKLKYWTSENRATKLERVNNLAKEVVKLIDDIVKLIKIKKDIDLEIACIVPVPPSKERDFQPVIELAKKIGIESGIAVNITNLKKVKETSQLKEIEDEQEREDILKDAFDVDENCFLGKNIILFDDLYRSGATLKSISAVLKNKGKAKNVIVITSTKTRTKK